jgi:mediator of RNA polymerase II transcription subunit 14
MPLTDAEVAKTFLDIEEAIRCRLRMSDIIPVEMANYRIGKMSSLEFFEMLIYI